MAKRKTKRPASKEPVAATPKPGNLLPVFPDKFQWLTDPRFLVPLALYIVMLFVWSKVIFGGMALNVSPDRLASISLRRIMANSLSEGIFPFWNPFYYGGMAMFESFQSSWRLYPLSFLGEGLFADPANPGFYNVGIAWLLFFGSSVDFLLIHYLIGAVGIAYLVRRFGGNGWIQFIAGLLFLLSPQLVVLADVGHGSKLYAMCWIPWALLTYDWVAEKTTLVRLGWTGIVFSMLMFTQHIQVAYYGYMLVGLWWLARFIVHLKAKETIRGLKELALFGYTVVAGIASTALIYFNTLTYSHDTIRGQEGVGWDYATNWSYHPLESFSLFAPDFYGFGGQTYWGFLPFTDMPLYWGIPALVLSIVALAGVRNWKVYTLFAAGFLAWVTSFGRFLPVLYKPFYSVLPYFNKFRVPMMIHILVLISAVVLAGIGLQYLYTTRKSGKREQILAWRKRLMIVLIGSAALFLITLVLKPALTSSFADWIRVVKPQQSTHAMSLADQSVNSLLRSWGLMTITIGLLYALFKTRISSLFVSIGLILIVLIDLGTLAPRLMHPRSPSLINQYFQEDKLVEMVKNLPDGRLLPVDNVRPMNSWATFGIQIPGGYTGSKPASYGYLQEKQAITHPNVLSVMNVRVIYSTRPIQGFQQLYSGDRGNLYAFPDGMQRGYLRTKWEVIEDQKETLDRLISKDFEPRKQLILNKEPGTIKQDTASTKGFAKITEYHANSVNMEVQTSIPAVMVVSEAYASSGWTATVNGKPVEILKAYGLIRAVEVPKGKSEVVFTYKPKHWTMSLVISVLTWVSFLGLIVFGLFTGKKVADDQRPVAAEL